MTDLPSLSSFFAQNNGVDCGVFACKFADFLSLGYEPDFTQNDIDYYRTRIAAEFAKGRLLDDPEVVIEID